MFILLILWYYTETTGCAFTNIASKCFILWSIKIRFSAKQWNKTTTLHQLESTCFSVFLCCLFNYIYFSQFCLTINIYSSIRDTQSKNKALGDDTEIKQTCLHGSAVPFSSFNLKIEHFIWYIVLLTLGGGI